MMLAAALIACGSTDEGGAIALTRTVAFVATRSSPAVSTKGFNRLSEGSGR